MSYFLLEFPKQIKILLFLRRFINATCYQAYFVYMVQRDYDFHIYWEIWSHFSIKNLPHFFGKHRHLRVLRVFRFFLSQNTTIVFLSFISFITVVEGD